MSEKVFISPAFLKDKFAGKVFLLHFECIISLLPCQVSAKKSASSLTGIALYVRNFSFAAFEIIFVLDFSWFYYSVSWRSFWVQSVRALMSFMNLMSRSLPRFEKVSVITSLNKFPCCSSGTPALLRLFLLMVSHDSLFFQYFLSGLLWLDNFNYDNFR